MIRKCQYCQFCNQKVGGIVGRLWGKYGGDWGNLINNRLKL